MSWLIQGYIYFMNFAKAIYIGALKWACNLMIFADGSGSLFDRANAFFRSMFVIAPIAFALSTLREWYVVNMEFTLIAVLFVLVNSFFGAIMHQDAKRFSWEKLLIKTVKMMMIIAGVYFVLQGIISPLEDNVITYGFKTTLKVATLLYPGAKILKNIFILSKGEHPPKWLMKKVYNFQTNGDLSAFLETNIDKNVSDNED